MILKERDKRFLERKLAQLRDDVRLIVFTQESGCQYCREMVELVEETASLSEKISTEIYDLQSDRALAEKWKVDKVPAVLIFGREEYGIRFFGLPSGYEFTAFIDDLIDVSKGMSRLQPQVKEKVRSIAEPVHLQVFVTPTCPYCPRIVRVAHQMAIENRNITADMVEALEFPNLASKYQVMAVPKIIVNDAAAFEGAVPDHAFVEYVILALKEISRLKSR